MDKMPQTKGTMWLFKKKKEKKRGDAYHDVVP